MTPSANNPCHHCEGRGRIIIHKSFYITSNDKINIENYVQTQTCEICLGMGYLPLPILQLEPDTLDPKIPV